MVIAYLRVSTGRQHIENQESEILRYAESRDIKIDKWVTETISGKMSRDDRKLGRLIRSLKCGDTMIVTEISRLSRTLHEVMAIMGICLEKKVTVYSIKDGYAFDDSINSKVLSFAFGLVAEIERNLISQRTKEALALRREQGVRLGREKGDSPKLRILEEHYNDILNLITDGESVIRICRLYEVSVETFRHYRKIHPEVDEMLIKRLGKYRHAALIAQAKTMHKPKEAVSEK